MVDLFLKSLFSKIQNWVLFKNQFTLFHSQAPGNPGSNSHLRVSDSWNEAGK